MNILTFEFPDKIVKLSKKNFKDKLKIKIKNLKYDYKFFFDKSYIFLVVGRPIIGESVDFKGVIKLTESFTDIKKINGEFLIIKFNLKEKKLDVINDRFASIPFFYFKTRKYFFGSLNYLDVLKKLNSEKKLLINEYKIYEFLRFQRIFGNENYDKMSRTLLAYNKLELKNNKIYLSRYWSPKFIVDNNKSIDWYANKFNFLIDQSINRKFSSNEKKLAFFLSGGIDSRSFLSKISKKIITSSVTISTKLNNEVKVAKEVSKKLSIKNNFFSLGQNPYKSKIKEMSLRANGRSSFDHLIFLNIKRNFFNKFDISSSGWGIDIYFQGYYIPIIKQKILNYFPTFFYKLDKSIFNVNLVDFFMNNLPYRNKSKNLFGIINQKYKKIFDKKLNQQISSIYKNARLTSANPVNVYNHMTVNDMGNHYSISNIISMNYCKKNTCIMFDNDLLEFYYTVPYQYLVNKKLYRYYIKKFIDKEISEVRTGNENIKFTLSPLYKTIIWYVDKILTKLKLRDKTIFYNPLSERTWPARQDVLRESDIKKYLREMIKGNYLNNLTFINKNKLATFLNQANNKNEWYAASVIYYLITINELLKGAYKK